MKLNDNVIELLETYQVITFQKKQRHHKYNINLIIVARLTVKHIFKIVIRIYLILLHNRQTADKKI